MIGDTVSAGQSSERPIGTVTFLFTDIEGSTRLLDRLGARYGDLLTDHHRLIRAAVEGADGTEISTEGDAFFVVFRSAADAVRAAVTGQRSLAEHRWPEGVGVAVRMGIHTGQATLVNGEYVGMDIHRAARIAAAAHGGQVLLSAATRDLAVAALPADVTLRDLGRHMLKDIESPERLWQLDVAGLRVEFPPPRTRSARWEVLPEDLTAFVGRETELGRLRELLRTTRMLTLTGPAGTGKTRLAVALAGSVADRYEAGVAFVPLAAITDHGLVASTIRTTLGLAEQAGSAAVETIVAAVGEQDLLLVLDNFEQVQAAAHVVARLLDGLRASTFIVTSRSALHITGEQEYPVPPLGLPDPLRGLTPEAIEASEAVRLFTQRARALRPDFRVTDANAPAVVEIVERLDGLPLALELAASRIKLLPPEAIVSRLGRRLDLLQSSTVDRSDRQRTLRGAIDWSHDLLGPEERRGFRRIAIAVGGADLADAEALIEAGGDGVGDPLAIMGSLVDHSLLRQEETVGEPRLRMLETIREYGLERLEEAGESEALARAHATRYLRRAIELSPRFTAGPEALDVIERDHDNVRAALRWAVANGEGELAMSAGGALWRFWHLRGHLREGKALLEAALACPSGPKTSMGRARALYGLASLAYWLGQYEEARHSYEDALEVARGLGDRTTEAEILYALGYVRAIPGDFGAAREAFAASRDLAQASGERLAVANAVFGLALVDYLDGRYADARDGIEASLARYQALGDTWSVTNAEAMLGRALQYLDEPDASRAHTLAALDLWTESGDLTGVSMAMRDLAALEGYLGNHERALRLEGAARGIDETLGGQAPPTLVKVRDPVEMARSAGMSGEALESLLDEGRGLGPAEAMELVRASG
jgi:predicted ATPase/class 3 adenylate cyclase